MRPGNRTNCSNALIAGYLNGRHSKRGKWDFRTAPTIQMVFIIVAVSMCSVSHAATMDDYVTCSLVYGGLFQAAKNVQHDGMLSYSKPRLQAVLPYLQENKDDPGANEKLRQIATRLEDEIKNVFIKQATDAILKEDAAKLEGTMPRVFRCDKAFGLSTLPLPFAAKQSLRWNKFLEGFHAGCLAKQRKGTSPFNDDQIQRYCRCMTDEAAVKGVDSRTSEETAGSIINESHGACFASIH